MTDPNKITLNTRLRDSENAWFYSESDLAINDALYNYAESYYRGFDVESTAMHNLVWLRGINGSFILEYAEGKVLARGFTANISEEQHMRFVLTGEIH